MATLSCSLRLLNLFRYHRSIRYVHSSRSLNFGGIRSSSNNDNISEFDRLGTWDSRLELPLMEESSIRRGTPIPKIDVSKIGVSTSRGRRDYQEDYYTISEPRDDLLLLGVWDGHGGDECAAFCAQNVVSYLQHNLDKEDINLEKVLTKIILDLNTGFEIHWKKNDHGDKNPGTTATLALIRDGYELVVAQVGDSKAILCRDGDPRVLTRDHCPSNPEENRRILACGGSVSQDTIGRHLVNRRLAMSRSLGDLDLKQYGVIPDPELTRMRIKHGKDRFLVLTTDGVPFVMSDKEIIECIDRFNEDPQQAADRLVDQALLYACEDNATVLILPLGSWGKGDPARTSMFYSIGRNMALTSRFS